MYVRDLENNLVNTDLIEAYFVQKTPKTHRFRVGNEFISNVDDLYILRGRVGANVYTLMCTNKPIEIITYLNDECAINVHLFSDAQLAYFTKAEV